MVQIYDGVQDIIGSNSGFSPVWRQVTTCIIVDLSPIGPHGAVCDIIQY